MGRDKIAFGGGRSMSLIDVPNQHSRVVLFSGSTLRASPIKPLIVVCLKKVCELLVYVRGFLLAGTLLFRILGIAEFWWAAKYTLVMGG